jgi:hypothetical protein
MAKRIKVVIDLSKTAFDKHQGREAARILRDIASDLEQYKRPIRDHHLCSDIKGNVVGTWRVF